jgi:hypothetical protein
MIFDLNTEYAPLDLALYSLIVETGDSIDVITESGSGSTIFIE